MKIENYGLIPVNFQFKIVPAFCINPSLLAEYAFVAFDHLKDKTHDKNSSRRRKSLNRKYNFDIKAEVLYEIFVSSSS